MNLKTEYLKKLNLKDPYPYINSLNMRSLDGPLWGGKSDIFSSLIKETRPKLIIELGAFLGNSTISMAKTLKENNIECIILTIDTWLGSSEHWLQNKCNLLHLYNNFEFGISSMYNQFLSNVNNEGLSEYIIPIPTTTDTAFEILSYNNFKADIIYMDADHREEIVYTDLVKYSKLLNDNGIIFGHDIDWQGVKNAVIKYCNETNKSYVELMDNLEKQTKFWRII